ncbi:MAG: type II secretion system F family protein [bacterium]|nr:type II secretion system F family protein [bacterium]
MDEYTFLVKKNNKYSRGEIFAVDEKAAIDNLHKKGFAIIKLDKIRERNILDRFKKVKPEIIVMMFRQMSVMVSAGIPILRILDALAANDLPHRFTKALKRIHADVSSGYSVAQAMRLFPEYFSPFMIGSVQIGELSGKLPETLESCADNLEREYEYTLKLRQALIYPTVLLVCLGLLSLFCFSYMLPMFLNIFGDISVNVPRPTAILMNFSDFLRRFGPVIFWTLIGPIIFGIWYLKKILKTRSGRWNAEKLLLKIPCVGHYVSLHMQGRYFRMLGTLLKSGVTLSSALGMLSVSLEHEILRAMARFQMASLKEGGTFISGLRRTGLCNASTLELLHTGEETGNIAGVLHPLANYIDEEISDGLSRLSRLIEPIILAILGTGIAFILLAAFMPIYSLAQSF